MSGHKCCFHSLGMPGIQGCCGCDASLLPGSDYEREEKNHGFSESRLKAMRASALSNLGTVMASAQAIAGPPPEPPPAPKLYAIDRGGDGGPSILVLPPGLNGR